MENQKLVGIREYLNKQNMFGIRSRSWSKEDAISFFSRWGIELVFDEAEHIKRGQHLKKILIGFYRYDYDPDESIRVYLGIGDDSRIYIGSKIAADLRDVLAALAGRESHYAEHSDLQTEALVLLAEYTSESKKLKIYETELNFYEIIDHEEEYWVTESDLPDFHSDTKGRPSLICRTTRRVHRETVSETVHLDIFYEDGHVEEVKGIVL